MTVKIVTYIESISELEKIISYKSRAQVEIIVGMVDLSRFSKNSYDDLITLIFMAAKNKLDVILEWDILEQEEKFLNSCDIVDRLPLHDLKAIRLQDPGAIHFIKNKYSWLKIQLVLENGNHNLAGLVRWSEYLGDQCERLILSNEISKEKLREYAATIKRPIEILVFGRILLFYSPRKLLSPLEKQEMEGIYLEAIGSSEESPHSGFPIIENSHGTFMFNVKDLYLLDNFDELIQMNLKHFRVDLRFDDSFNKNYKQLFAFLNDEVKESDLKIKKNNPRPVIKGFYNINKSDVLFDKLKNKKTQRLDKSYIGEIVDVERDCQLAIMIKNDILKFDQTFEIKLITPEGKEKNVRPAWIKSSSGEIVGQALKNDLIIIPFLNGVTVKTQVYFKDK